MSDLIAIGYPAEAAADEARLGKDLVIEPDAIAVIVRDKKTPAITSMPSTIWSAAGRPGHVLGPAVLHPGLRDGQVRRHRAEDLTVQGRREGTLGRLAQGDATAWHAPGRSASLLSDSAGSRWRGA
jgi:hypothetical protein